MLVGSLSGPLLVQDKVPRIGAEGDRGLRRGRESGGRPRRSCHRQAWPVHSVARMTQAAHPSVHGGDDPDPCRAEATGVSDDQRSCRGPPLAVRVRPSGGARCKTVRIGKPRTRASVASMTAGTVLFLFSLCPGCDRGGRGRGRRSGRWRLADRSAGGSRRPTSENDEGYCGVASAV